MSATHAPSRHRRETRTSSFEISASVSTSNRFCRWRRHTRDARWRAESSLKNSGCSSQTRCQWAAPPKVTQGGVSVTSMIPFADRSAAALTARVPLARVKPSV